MLYYSTAFLLLIVGSVLTFDRPVPLFRPWTSLNAARPNHWNVMNGQQIRLSRLYNEYLARQYLFNILYGNFNFYHPPPPSPTIPTTPTTTTTTTPTTSTTPKTTTTTTPAPECFAYACDCCVFESVDPNYPGMLGLQSPNYPADYGDNLNCTFQISDKDPQFNVTFTTFVMKENFDFLKIYDAVTNEVFANISGYSVPAPLVIDTNTHQYLVDVVSGSNGGASIPVDKGPRKFEFYVAYPPARMAGDSASMFKEITN